MPISADQLQQLKRTNISQDAEKTKQRVEELLRPAKIALKKEIRELAGITSQVFHNIYSNGNLSIKTVLAIAQTLNINPFYLTGEADEPGRCTDARIRELLLKHGYREFVASIELPEARQAKAIPTPEEAPVKVPDAQEAPEEEPLPQAAPALPSGSDTLTVEDLQQLIYALCIQAKAGIANAKEKLDQIKLTIFS